MPTQFADIGLRFLGVGPQDRKPELDQITEGRFDQLKGYGWCGDFATWVAMLAGCRDPAALNRVAVAGEWASGQNIARLLKWARATGAWRPGIAGVRSAKRGDFVINQRPNGDHIGIVLAREANGLHHLDGNGWWGKVSQGVSPYTPSLYHGIIKTDGLVAAVPDIFEPWTPWPVPAVRFPVDTPFPLGWLTLPADAADPLLSLPDFKDLGVEVERLLTPGYAAVRLQYKADVLSELTSLIRSVDSTLRAQWYELATAAGRGPVRNGTGDVVLGVEVDRYIPIGLEREGQ